jgi:hypothetical protein
MQVRELKKKRSDFRQPKIGFTSIIEVSYQRYDEVKG